MKIFSDAKTLSPAAARNCLLMNLFATPGLGSLMGGRIIAGLGQLILFLMGFAFVCIWFYRLMKHYYSLSDFSLQSGAAQPSYFHYFLAGFLLAGASWLWSLLSSIRMVAQAKTPEPAQPGSVPPRITK
jgi:hypothetical protein